MPTQESQILAPTRGWNDRDNIASMENGFATVLDNINPKSRECISRGGTILYSTIPGGVTIKTLMPYDGKTSQFFACEGENIWNITDGQNPIVSESGRTSDINDFVMFTNTGVSFLYVVNGFDNPFYYNGTTWVEPSFTFPSPEVPPPNEAKDFFAISVHQQRIYFLERNSLTFWYLAVNSVSGDVKSFPLGGIFEFGGNLCAFGSWSRDSGSGAHDLMCFFTDRGEVAIYQGTDPGDIDNWSLVSVFKIGTPAGFPQDLVNPDNGLNSMRITLKIGSDLFILTSYGLIAMSHVLSSGFSSESTAVSDTIVNSFSTEYEKSRNDFGWQILEYAKNSMVVVNVPQLLNNLSYQFVMNSINYSWSRWTGLNYLCWGIFKQELYCSGMNGIIAKADTGYNDLGQPINCGMVTSYEDFGSLRRKKFHQMRSYIETNADILFTLDVDVDYKVDYQSYRVLIDSEDISFWGTATWGINKWSQIVARANTLTRLSQIGTSAAVHCFFQTHDYPVTMKAFNINYSISGRI